MKHFELFEIMVVLAHPKRAHPKRWHFHCDNLFGRIITGNEALNEVEDGAETTARITLLAICTVHMGRNGFQPGSVESVTLIRANTIHQYPDEVVIAGTVGIIDILGQTQRCQQQHNLLLF